MNRGSDGSNSVFNQRRLLDEFYQKHMGEFESSTQYIDDGHAKRNGQRKCLFLCEKWMHTSFWFRPSMNISFIYISNSDSLDWKDPTPQQISSRVISRVKPGSIVLFHNGAKNTPAALPTVLQTLQTQGYQIVPVSQLIYKSDYTIDNAGMQIPKSVALKTPSSALPPR